MRPDAAPGMTYAHRVNGGAFQRIIRWTVTTSGMLAVVLASFASPTIAFNPGSLSAGLQPRSGASSSFCQSKHRPCLLRAGISCRMSASGELDPSDIPRKELQAMAKQFGVRANMKSAEIVNELTKLGAFEKGGESPAMVEPTPDGMAEVEAQKQEDIDAAEPLSGEVIEQVVAQVDGLGRIEVEEREFEVPCAVASFGKFAAVSGQLCWAEPATATEALTNGKKILGKLVLVRRGGCSFVAKALRVQEAGGGAMVLVNNEGGAGMFKPGDPNGEDRGSVQIPVVMVSLEDGELLGGGGVGDLSVMDLELLKQDFVALAEKESRSAGAEKKSRTASARTTRDNIGPKEDRKSARPPTTEASERPENARSKRVEQALQGVKLKDMLEYLKRDPGFEEMFLRTGIRVFGHEPSVKSALKFLRAPGSEWARRKVEGMYLAEKRKTR